MSIVLEYVLEIAMVAFFGWVFYMIFDALINH